MNIKKLLLSFLLMIVAMTTYAVVQPKIMVIPYTKEGEDIRTVIQDDQDKRVILTKIKEAFDKRGVSTVDFLAKLKSIESGNIMHSENKQDVKTEIIDMSGADIYVEAEMAVLRGSSNGQSSARVKIIITAYDASTGSSLANTIGESGTFYTDDIAKLGMKAIENCADNFLNMVQEKFTTMAEEGKSVMLQIGFDENASLSMESEVGTDGLALQDAIELWIEEHSYQGNYHMQGVSKNKMVVDDIKLPHTQDSGVNYTSSKFSMDLFKFFRSLGISVTRSVRGNTILVTIK